MNHHQAEHDPSGLSAARQPAEPDHRVPIGLFCRNPAAPCYCQAMKSAVLRVRL